MEAFKEAFAFIDEARKKGEFVVCVGCVEGGQHNTVVGCELRRVNQPPGWPAMLAVVG